MITLADDHLDAHNIVHPTPDTAEFTLWGKRYRMTLAEL